VGGTSGHRGGYFGTPGRIRFDLRFRRSYRRICRRRDSLREAPLGKTPLHSAPVWRLQTPPGAPTGPTPRPGRRSAAVRGLRASWRPLGANLPHGGGLGSRPMPALPRVTGREVVRALQRLGWVVVVQKGSHAQLKHPDRGGRVTVPLHAGKTIGPGLLRSILAQGGLTVAEFIAAL